jgi:hypothetical protein
MTKKKVRIYKAPDGKGQYINKTAKFLKKAAFGGQSDTPQEDMYSQLAQAAYMSIKKGQSPKAVYDSLINNKISKDVAEKIVTSVIQFMMSKGELEQEDLYEDQQKELQKQAQMQQQQQEKEQMASEQDAANEAQMDMYNKQSMDVANDMSQYDQEAEANLDTEDILGFQTGGQMTTDDLLSELNKHNNDINFQDLESLIQSTPGTQSASFPGIEEYYLPYIPLYSESNEIPIYNPIKSDNQYKFGGKTKKKFIGSVLELLKKEEGGEDEVINNTTATPKDDLTNTVKRKQDSFVSAISDEAKKIKIEEYYNQIKNTNDPDTQEILGGGPDQMKRGGRTKRKDNRLIRKLNRILGQNDMYGMQGYMPYNYFNKRSGDFANQRFDTSDYSSIAEYYKTLLEKMPVLNEMSRVLPQVDVYETGLFGRPKKYKISYNIQPVDKSAERQAMEAVIKNNTGSSFPMLYPDPGYDGSPAPAGTMLDVVNDRSIAPIQYDASVKPMVPTGPMAFQFGGSAIFDPSASTLAKYIYGGNDFPEDSKNVNDPYFSDTTPYPQMQDGGDPTEYTHYTHGADDVFHDNMNMITQAKDGLETGGDEYALDYIRQLAGQMKQYNKASRKLGRQARRMTGNTMLDYLIPINRPFEYAGSYGQQRGMPFDYETGEEYTGEIDPSNFVARDVYKTGMFGKPKKFIDYYSVGNEGLNVPISEEDIIPYREQIRSQKQDQSNLTSGDRLDRRIARWDRRAARNEEEYQPMEGSITNYENPEDFYNAVNPVSEEDAEFLGAGFTPSSEYTNKGKVRKVRDAEGNWYDRNEEMIPGKKSPSEVPGYYDKKQEGGEPNQDDYYNDLFSKLNYSNTYSNYYNELGFRKGGRVLRKAFAGLENTPVSYNDNPVTSQNIISQNTPDPMEQMTAFQGPIIEDSEFNFPTDLPGPAPITDAYVEPAEDDWSGPQMSNKAIDYPAGPTPLKNKLVGVKRKRKDMFNIDPEAGVNAFNAGARGVLGGIDRMRNKKQEANMYAKNFDPTKIYGQKSRIDKGDYDVNKGLYRVNQMGADRLGRSKKYGGYMQPGGIVDQQMYYPEDNMVYPPGDSQYPMIPINRDIMDMLYNRYYSNPNFVPYMEDTYMEEAPQQVDYRMVKEGGETYMSDEQINAFLAAGGEIEYL